MSSPGSPPLAAQPESRESLSHSPVLLLPSLCSTSSSSPSPFSMPQPQQAMRMGHLGGRRAFPPLLHCQRPC